MNIWRWVNETERKLRREGHGRLADLIDRLPTEICEDRHTRADAMYPEALALARSLELEWVEVFLRHWMLQSRVLHRMEGTSALGEAVALVEYAHRPETKDCPQAVCAVQDLASCYGLVDGPGYADDRLAVCDETLSRIDPSWPCYGCISAEYAGAMRDQGQLLASLAFVDQQVGRMVAAGDSDAIYDLPNSRIEPLIALGRLDEALAFTQDCVANGRKDASHQMERRIDLARVHVRAGRYAEALAALPKVADVVDTPQHYPGWADAVERLVHADALPNDFHVGHALCTFTERLLRQGVGRTTLELAEKHGHLALMRGAPHVAERALRMMEGSLPVLRKPLDALDRIGKLRAAIAAAPSIASVSLPEDPTTLLECTPKDDPERSMLMLEASALKWPDDPAILRALAGVLAASGHEDEARARLRGFFDTHQATDPTLVVELAELYRRIDDKASFESLVAALDARKEPTLPNWLRAVDAFARGDAAAALVHVAPVLEGVKDAKNARRLAAEAARQTGDLATALERLDELAALLPEPGPHHWDRMTVATVLGQHDKVRDSAARLELPVPQGEGPIDLDWGICRIRFAEEDAQYDAFAQRTGPVTARIVQIRRPGAAQHFDDRVVFDAQPANPPPGSDEEREGHTFVYPWVATVQPGEFTSYALDGVHPGEAALDALRERLTALGCPLQIASDDTYRVGPSQDLPGLYAFVAMPKTMSCKDLSAVLVEATAALPHPLIWLELVAAAGDVELVDRQVEIRAEYGL